MRIGRPSLSQTATRWHASRAPMRWRPASGGLRKTMNAPIKTAMGAREWAMLIALSILWGGSFLFVGVAVKELPPLTITAMRLGLAALALAAVMRVIGIDM